MRPVQVISLDRRDGVRSARELVRAAASESQVWLTVPWRAAWARSLVNLSLLRRVAEGANVELHIVSKHSETRTLAREAGLAAHFSLPATLGGQHADRSRLVPVEKPLDGRWGRRSRPIGMGTVLIALGVVGGLLAILIGSAALFMPAATVRISPAAQHAFAHLDVTADPRYTEIDYDAAVVPARNIQVSIEGRGETDATGAAVVPDQPASGQVIFSNRADVPVHIPAGTVVRTRSGQVVKFVTTADVEVPGSMYATARVGIVAEQPGLEGNVKELAITMVEGSLASAVDVLNDSPTYGGTTKNTPVISAEDLDRLPGVTMATLAAQAYDRLIPEMEQGEFIPEDAFEILVMEQYYEQAVGQRADKATMEMRVLVNGLAVDGADLETLATRFLETRHGGSLAVIPSSLRLSRSPGSLVYSEDQRTRWFATTLSVEGALAPVVDQAALKSALAGKTVSGAKAWLAGNLELAEEPEIVMSPGGWPFLPRLTGRITIEILAEAD